MNTITRKFNLDLNKNIKIKKSQKTIFKKIWTPETSYLFNFVKKL